LWLELTGNWWDGWDRRYRRSLLEIAASTSLLQQETGLARKAGLLGLLKALRTLLTWKTSLLLWD
jgi:hypothetical protein